MDRRFLFFFSLIALFSGVVQACTTWAATGEGVTEGGKTLVAKVLDESPDLRRMICRVADGRGYAFYGLLVGRNARSADDSGHLNSGVNEKGLFVGGSTASTVPKSFRSPRRWRSPEGWRSREYLLRTSATVDEALAKTYILRAGYPEHLILADKDSVATVQTLEDGTFLVERTSRGFVVGTNHFTGEAISFNRRRSLSSETRYARAKELMAALPRPMPFKSFAAVIHDQDDGPDNSIWREGSNEESSRTLAAVACRINGDGTADFYEIIQEDFRDRNSPWRERWQVLDLKSLGHAR